MISKFVVKFVLPMWYKLCCMARVKDNILFVIVRGDKISSDFNMVKKIIKRDEELNIYNRQYHFLTLGVGTKIKYIKRCFTLMPKLAKAKYVFMDDGSNVVSALKLRKGTKLVQTWHGCGALKKFGHSIPDGKTYFGNEDIVTVSSPLVVGAYKEAMSVSEESVYPIGVPHTDLYFSKSFRERCIELREEILNGKNKKIILYAPTFRGDIKEPKDPSGINLDLMYKHLGQEYMVISKLHPSMRPVRKSCRHRDFYFDVSGRWTIEEALMVSDILITDYSAIIFDYSLLNKPLVLYAYDLEEYSANPGFYMKYNEIPGKVCNSTMDIIKEIKNGYFDVNAMKVFKERYMNSCDGRATKRLIEKLKTME